MGEPAMPTPAEREQTRAYARRVVDAVRNDEVDPWALGGNSSEAIFRLAQEVLLLCEENKR